MAVCVCGCVAVSVGAVGAVSGSLVLSCCLSCCLCLGLSVSGGLVLSLVVFSGVGGLWVWSGVLCGSLGLWWSLCGSLVLCVWSVCLVVWSGLGRCHAVGRW